MNISTTWHDVDEPSKFAQDRVVELVQALSKLVAIKIKNEEDILSKATELRNISGITKDVNDDDL